MPTPIEVIVKAVGVLQDRGLLGGHAASSTLVDAGAGDGRVLAILAWFDQTRPVYGIEQDSALHAQASANLRTLQTEGLIDCGHVTVIQGNYCDLNVYESHGIAPRDIGIILNYPDGNEERLAQFVSENAGPQTRLCLLTHDRSLDLDELELRDECEVRISQEPAWRLSIYGLAMT